MEKKLSKPELEKKAKKLVLNSFDSFSQRSGLEDKWRHWDKMYNLIPGEKNYDGVANLFPPETRRSVETLHDFADDVLFPAGNDWFRLKGVETKTQQKKAEVYKKIADWQNDKIKVRSKFSTALRRCIKYGFVIVKVPYVFKEKYAIRDAKEREKIWKMFKDIASGKEKIEKTARTVMDSIDLKIISPFNLFWNYYRPWEEQTIIIEKIDNVSNSHLKLMEKKGVYKNIDKVIEDQDDKDNSGSMPGGSGGGTESASDTTDPNDKWPHLSEITGLAGYFDDGKFKNTLLEAHLSFDIDQDGYDEEVIMTIANGKRVIRFDIDPNDIQEKPYLWCPWEELEDTSLGRGACEIAGRSQLALNDFTNQTMDDISEILDCARVIDLDAMAEGQDLNTRNKKIYKTRGVPPEQAVAFIRPPNVAQVGLNAANQMREDIRNGTGANVSLQGLAARYDTTATEYTKQGNAAGKGVLAKLKRFEDNIITEYLRFQFWYNRQYLDRETFIKIVGMDAATAHLQNNNDSLDDALDIDAEFMALGITQIENKIIKGQQLINYFNVVKGVPQASPIIMPLMRKIWNTVGDGDDSFWQENPADESISPEDENILMSHGIPVIVHAKDNHLKHILAHQKLELIPEFQPNKDSHLNEHAMAMKALAMPNLPGQIGVAQPGQSQQAPMAPKVPLPGNNGVVPGLPAVPAGSVK